MKRFLILALLLCGSAFGQTFDCFGGLITDNQGNTAPVGPGVPNQQAATFSRSGTTVTATVTNGAVYAIGEPMAAIGTGTALDWSNAVCAANLIQSQAGGLKITNVVGNTLTLSSPASGTITSHSGTIKPLRLYQATVAGRVRFFTPLDHWIFGQDIDQASAPVIAKYGSNACNTARDEYIALNSLGNLAGEGFNGIGHASAGQFYDGGACPSNIHNPFFPEEAVFSYFGDNLKQNSFNGVAQPGKDMNWATNSNYSCQGVKRPSLDTLDPLFESFVQGWIGGNFSDPAYFQSAFIKGITFQDSGNAMGAPTNSGWQWNTYPTGRNDCHQGLLLLATSPVQGGSGHVLYGGTPNGPNAFPSLGYYLYPDSLNYLKGRNVLTTCDWSVSTLVCSLREYLQWKYSNSISSLNTAWSSSYSGFGSSGTAVTSETYGTGNGSTTSFSHNFVSGNVDPNSVQIYLNGAPIGFDCPTGQASCPVSAGTGRFKGTNISGGTLTYSSGVSTLTFSVAPPNTQVISINYVHDGWGEGGTGLMDEDGTNEGTNGVAPVALAAFQNSHAYALNDKISVSGSWQVVTTAGTSQSASTPSWSSTAGVTTTSGTAIFTSEGAPVQGSGGSYTGTLPNANMGADLEAYEAYIGAAALSPLKTALTAVAPNLLNWCVDQIGVAFNPPAQGILQAANTYCDVAMTSLGDSAIDPLGPAKYTEYTKFFPGPISNYQAFVSDQGAFSANGNVPDFATRQQMGQAWYTLESYWLNQVGFNGTRQGANIQWTSNVDGLQSSNFGIETAATSPYNGHDNVVASVSCLFNSFTCGSESSATWNGTDSITRAGCGLCIADATKLWVAAPPQSGACTSTLTIPPPINAPFAGFVGAGTYVANPEPQNFGTYGCFGLNNPWSRVSDRNTAFNACTLQGAGCTGKLYQSMFVSSSDGSDNHFTLNDEQFVVVDGGNSAYIFDNHFPAPSTIRYVGFPNYALRWGTTTPVASWTKAKTFLDFANSAGTANGTVLSYYDTSTTWPTLPGRTTIIDFASSVNGVPAGAVNQTDPVTCNHTETNCATGFSTTVGQGSSGACYVADWSMVNGFSVWNTCTGMVTGDYGTTGAAVCVNCAGAPISPGTFAIHNVKASQDMSTLIVQTTASSCVGCLNQSDPYQWVPGTTNVYTSCPTPSSHCSGHFVSNGELSFINEYSTPNWVSKLFGATSGTTFPVGTTCTSEHDQHASWLNDNLTDTKPFFVSNTADTSNPTYNTCNVAEIDAIDPPAIGDNLTFRYGHSNGAAVSEFAGRNQIMAISPTGNYALVTSPQANSSSFIGQLGDASGNYPCTVLANCASDVFLMQTAGLPGLGSPSFFGFTETSTAPANFPVAPTQYGMQRIWDSPPLQWPSINTSAGVFNFTNLDTMLAQDFTNSVPEVMYTLSRTPPWITSNPTDTTCSYQLPAPGGGHGECYPPTDLNSDGSGTNATWKAWITAIATHANNPTYLATHAHIRYWEIWNEPDATQYWMGSFAQLSRLTEDANCIITGRGVVHQSGNGSATTCTATPIDPSAQIVMSSGHASSATVLTYAQNQLYCNATSGIPAFQLPCPNPANATAAALDAINFHLKPGNATGNNCPSPTPCTVETAMAQYVTKIDAFLQPAELAKPLWDGEMSYAVAGFVAPYNTPDMCSSFIPRMYLTMWTLGFQGSALYTWDNLKAQGTQCVTSYQQTYNYLHGATLPGPCTASGTVYSCTIAQGGVSRLIMWDTSKACTGASCPTANQTVPNQWVTYQDMTSASSPIAIVSHLVPVGIKPVIMVGLGVAATPTFSPAAGTYTGAQRVTLSTTTPGALICWNTTGSPATNGTAGCTTGTLYTGFVTVSGTETVYAVAGGGGYADSSVGSAAYVIKTTAATPTFSPVAGTYTTTQTVTISTAAGGVICYNTSGAPATNGTTGCTTGTLYSTPVSVSSSETLYAVAGGTGFTDSAIGSAVYIITPASGITFTITGSGKFAGSGVIK